MILKVIPKVLCVSIMLADRKNMITFSILGFFDIRSNNSCIFLIYRLHAVTF